MPARSCRLIRLALALVCLLAAGQALAASGISRAAGGPEAAAPADASGLLRGAATALQNGDLGRAAALLEQGLTRLEPTPELLAMMADVYRQQGRLDDAAAAAEQALDLEPGFAPAHLMLGDVYQAMGWFESAAESFRLALAADPDAPAARVRLVRCLTAAGRVREAEAECRRFLAEQETASLTLILGETLQRQQRARRRWPPSIGPCSSSRAVPTPMPPARACSAISASTRMPPGPRGRRWRSIRATPRRIAG
jgi:tetratricopeptide (TPR) repeat protein